MLSDVCTAFTFGVSSVDCSESNEERSRLKSVGISRRVNGDLELSSIPKLPVFHVSRYCGGQDAGKSIRRRFLPLSAEECIRTDAAVIAAKQTENTEQSCPALTFRHRASSI